MSAVETPITIEATPEELIGFGWDKHAVRNPERYPRPLLSCGHYDRPTFESSSQWDFPSDEHVCPTCGETRQWDVRVQAAIYQAWNEET
jgi:hypothetical protein